MLSVTLHHIFKTQISKKAFLNFVDVIKVFHGTFKYGKKFQNIFNSQTS